MRSGRPRGRNELKKPFCTAPGSEIAAEFSAISSITGIIAPLSVALSDRVGASVPSKDSRLQPWKYLPSRMQPTPFTVKKPHE